LPSLFLPFPKNTQNKLKTLLFFLPDLCLPLTCGGNESASESSTETPEATTYFAPEEDHATVSDTATEEAPEAETDTREAVSFEDRAKSIGRINALSPQVQRQLASVEVAQQPYNIPQSG